MNIGSLKNAGFLALSCALLSACANYGGVPPVLTAQNLEAAPEYRIEPGDILDIKFFYSADLNENVTVRPDGRISLQLVDDVEAAGLTPSELDESLTGLYKKKLPDRPDVSVIVKGFGDQRVYVAGEVQRPGELGLKNHMTVFQAVASAGGLKDTAGAGAVLVVRQDADGRSQVFSADLSDDSLPGSQGSTAHAELMPRDIVYVPKSGIAKADLFMDQYVRQLLMFNGIAAGVTGVYELNDADEFNTGN